MTELAVAKKFADRLVTVELELLAARENYSEAVKDLTAEMKGKQLTPVQIKGVKKAAKIEVMPLERKVIADQVAEFAEAIIDTKRNGNQEPLA